MRRTAVNTSNNIIRIRFNTTWPAPECGKEFAFDGVGDPGV